MLPFMPAPIIGSLGVDASDPVTVTYIASYIGAGSRVGDEETHSNIDIGATPSAGYDRYIVAVQSYRIVGTGTSARALCDGGEIGGNTATVAVTAYAENANTVKSGMIIYGPFNTGTTTTIMTSWSGGLTSNDGMVSTYRVIVPQTSSTFKLAPYATASDTNSSTSDITCPANGYVIGGTIGDNGGNPSWTFITKDVGAQYRSGDYASTAHDEFTTPQIQQTIGATYSSETSSIWIAASWGP